MNPFEEKRFRKYSIMILSAVLTDEAARAANQQDMERRMSDQEPLLDSDFRNLGLGLGRVRLKQRPTKTQQRSHPAQALEINRLHDVSLRSQLAAFRDVPILLGDRQD